MAIQERLQGGLVERRISGQLPAALEARIRSAGGDHRREAEEIKAYHRAKEKREQADRKAVLMRDLERRLAEAEAMASRAGRAAR